MSIHKSLRLGDTLARRRNVLTRAERMAKMEAEGKLDEEGSVFGLPKLRVFAKAAKKKKKKEEAAEGAEGTEGGDAAAAGGEAEKKD